MFPLIEHGDFYHVWWRDEGSLHRHNDTDKTREGLIRLIKHSEVVIWDPDIRKVSVEGAEIFLDAEELPRQVVPTSQLWCYSDGRAFVILASDWADWLDIDEDCVCRFSLITMTPPNSSALFFPLIGIKSRIPHFRCIHSGRLLTNPQVKDEIGRVDPLTATAIASRLFLDTKVPIVAQCDVAKNVRKHWTKRREEIPLIRVVTMRESERSAAATSSESERSHSEFSHRWIVRPHWRKQPFGPGLADRRPTFINTYVKGPEDKPLIVKQTIFNATR